METEKFIVVESSDGSLWLCQKSNTAIKIGITGRGDSILLTMPNSDINPSDSFDTFGEATQEYTNFVEVKERDISVYEETGP